MGLPGHLSALRFIKPRVSGNDRQRGVGHLSQSMMPRLVLHQRPAGINKSPVLPCAREHLPVLIQHVTKCVDGHERRHRGTTSQANARGADSALAPVVPAVALADGRPGAGSNAAHGMRSVSGGLGGQAALRCTRATGIASDAEIKQGGSADDGHRGDTRINAQPLLLAPVHHPAGCVQSKCAATGKKDGRHQRDGGHRLQQVGLARCRPSTAHINAADSALRKDDGCAARACIRIGPVPHANSRNIGEHQSPPSSGWHFGHQ